MSGAPLTRRGSEAGVCLCRPPPASALSSGCGTEPLYRHGDRSSRCSETGQESGACTVHVRAVRYVRPTSASRQHMQHYAWGVLLGIEFYDRHTKNSQQQIDVGYFPPQCWVFSWYFGKQILTFRAKFFKFGSRQVFHNCQIHLLLRNCLYGAISRLPIIIFDEIKTDKKVVYSAP